jgi:long-chain acyl-CoA synthetase
MIKETLIGYIEQSIRKNWDIEALSNYREKGYTYREIAEKILRLQIFFKDSGIKEGDKIALVGRNSANWCVVYLASVTYGAVIVPILPDFKSDDLNNLVNHSDAVLLFVDDKIFEGLDIDKLPLIQVAISVDDFSVITARTDEIKIKYLATEEKFIKAYPSLRKEDFKFSDITNDKLAVISYTGGTTGFSKGVMITHNSLAANVRFAQTHMPLQPGDPLVSFLPLAHTYGCAFEFLFPFTIGCHITILSKTPSPQIIVQAFKEIRPRLILSVPLVIEKIF